MAQDPTQDFQEKMFLRVREQLGDLISDEDLKPMVEKAIEKAFFEPIKVRRNYTDFEEPPTFVTMIQKHMTERVDIALKAWITENPEVIEKILNDIIARGVVGVFTNYITNVTSGPLYQLCDVLRQKGIQV